MSCRGDCSEGASCTCRAADHDLVVGGDDDDDGNGGDGGGAGHGGVEEGGGVCRMAAGGSESKIPSSPVLFPSPPVQNPFAAGAPGGRGRFYRGRILLTRFLSAHWSFGT